MQINDYQLIKNSRLVCADVFTNSAFRALVAPIALLYHKPFWLKRLSPFFDGKFYITKNDFSKEGVELNLDEENPVLHYLKKGFKLGLAPSLFIDVDYVVEQVEPNEVHKLGIITEEIRKKVFLKYENIDQLFENLEINPNRFFDNNIAAKSMEKLGFPVNDHPLIEYFRHTSQMNHDTFIDRCIETCTQVSWKDYLLCNSDLIEHKVNPLEHFLEFGLAEGRKISSGELISSFLLKNAAALYKKENLVSPKEFINSAIIGSGPINQFSQTKFHTQSFPALAHKASNVMHSISIGIVVFENSLDELSRILKSILNEISVSNDCAIEFTFLVNDERGIEFYKQQIPEANLRINPLGNIGFGAAHNQLMKRAFLSGATYYIGANPDGYFLPGCVKRLIDFADFYDGEALVEANCLPLSHPKWFDPVLFDTPWVSGACFCISESIFSRTEGFDPDLHLYCEDVDLSWRVKLAAGRLKVCPTAYFYHDVTDRNNNSESTQNIIRNLHMLKGSYYLSMKWGQLARAAKIKAEFYRMRNGIDIELSIPPNTIDTSLAETVAFFENEFYGPTRL